MSRPRKPHPMLERSPYLVDENHEIGRNPSEVSTETLLEYHRPKNPIKVIRDKCRECCCGDDSEIRKCVLVDCHLWPYRMGKNPFRKKVRLTDEQRAARAANLQKARERNDAQD